MPIKGVSLYILLSSLVKFTHFQEYDKCKCEFSLKSC